MRLTHFFSPKWSSVGCKCGEGGGHSGTLLCCPAVTLLWNDVTARKWRRRGSHYWRFSNYFIPNKYSRKTPMARATSQLVSIATLIRIIVRSRFSKCSVSAVWQQIVRTGLHLKNRASRKDCLTLGITSNVSLLMLANAAPNVCFIKIVERLACFSIKVGQIVRCWFNIYQW